MNENPPSQTQPPPRGPSGAWRGVAGCFVTAGMTLICGVIGVLVGLKFMPPKWDPMKGGSEWHGLSVDMERLGWLVGGLLIGLVVGMVAGGVISYRLFRRR